MISKKIFTRKISQSGYVVLKDFFKKKTKSNLLNFANWYAETLVTSWSKNDKSVSIKKNNCYKKIIYYYKLFNRPEYRRNPQKNCANELFYKIISDPSFDKIYNTVKPKNWHFSFIKNLRFKSKVLPWSVSDWHCDRFTFSKYKNKDFKFLIFWIPLQKIDKNTGSDLEIVPKNIFSFKSFSKKYLNSQNRKKLFNVNKYKSKFKKTFIPKTKFGDLVIFDSDVIHRTTPAKKNSPLWSMDIRFEYGTKISDETLLGGFDMLKNKNYKLKKLINSAKIKQI